MSIPLYYYFQSEDFHYWVEQKAIPPELLLPSRVLDLHRYLSTHRSHLFDLLKSRPNPPKLGM